MTEKYVFDHNFYINFYSDIKFDFENNKLMPLEHYNNYGKKEKRVCCNDELNDNINTNNLLIKTQKEYLENIDFKNKIENKLNILIRTSMRPDFFKTCVESILTQKYNNYQIFICYDKEECLSYLKAYETNYSNITTFFVKNNSSEKYKFNLYNNDLMDKVQDGFILFLDDDDMFSHDLCFKIINENIIDDESILIWKFMRPDKLIYPKHINDIKLGEIDTTSICFHSKYKQLARWSDKQCGDFYFYTSIFKELKQLKQLNKLNIIKVNYILTKTIYFDKMCGSL